VIRLRLHLFVAAPSSRYPTGCPQQVFDLSATPACTACYEPPWPLCYDPEGPERLLPRSSHQATRCSPYFRPCGPFGLLPPKCWFPSTTLGFASFERAAFDFRRAGLGHCHLASGTSLPLGIPLANALSIGPACGQTVIQKEVRTRWFQCLLSIGIPHFFAFRMPATRLFRRLCDTFGSAIITKPSAPHLRAIVPRALTCRLRPRDYP